MANTIITKNSSTASAVPTSGDLVKGELAVNVTDKRLFTEDNGGNVVELGTNPSTINIDAGTIDGTTIGATTASTGAFTTLSATGNVTLGDASTDTVQVNGYMGVGGSPSSGKGIQLLSSQLTGSTQMGILSQPTANSSATTEFRSIGSYPVVANSSFTIPNVYAYHASAGSKGASATVTSWHGLYIADQTQGTNNYGISSLVSSGSNKWNIYASGTASNYFAGSVGIGTSSPNQKLEIAATSPRMRLTDTDGGYVQIEADNGNLFLVSDNGNTVANSTLKLGVDGSTMATLDSSGKLLVGYTATRTNGGLVQVNSAGKSTITALDTSAQATGVGGTIDLGGNYRAAGDAQPFVRIAAEKANATDSNYSYNMAFYTTPNGSATYATRVMTLDSSGYLLVGYTSSNGAYKLQVNSQIFATSSTIATSDARYKENVTPLSGALSLVNSLNPVQFSWKEHPVHAFDRSAPTIGFLAQEVQTALAGTPYLPSIVKTNTCTITPEVKDEEGNVTQQAVTEEFLGIAEGNMVALLTKAIQEQQAIIQSMQARLDAAGL